MPTGSLLPVLETAAPATPCAGCSASCCREYAVPLTANDVARIVADQSLDFWDFVCRWEDRDGLISRGIVPHFRFEDDPETRFVIGLRPVESRQLPGTRMCRFLDEASDSQGCGNSARCSVYESRPVVCRVFPFRWDSNGRVAVQPGVERGAEEVAGRPALCPSRWNLTDEQCEQAAADLEQCREEMAVLRLLAERWNRHPGPWELFPEFLRIVSARLNLVEA